MEFGGENYSEVDEMAVIPDIQAKVTEEEIGQMKFIKVQDTMGGTILINPRLIGMVRESFEYGLVNEQPCGVTCVGLRFLDGERESVAGTLEGFEELLSKAGTGVVS